MSSRHKANSFVMIGHLWSEIIFEKAKSLNDRLRANLIFSEFGFGGQSGQKDAYRIKFAGRGRSTGRPLV